MGSIGSGGTGRAHLSTDKPGEAHAVSKTCASVIHFPGLQVPRWRVCGSEPSADTNQLEGIKTTPASEQGTRSRKLEISGKPEMMHTICMSESLYAFHKGGSGENRKWDNLEVAPDRNPRWKISMQGTPLWD